LPMKLAVTAGKYLTHLRRKKNYPQE